MRVPGALLFAVALFTLGARSGATLSLTESSAAARAAEQNLSLSQARIELAARKLSADTAAGVLAPALSLTAGLTRANTAIAVSQPASPYNWTASAGLGASLTLSAAAVEGIQTTRLDYQAGRISFEQARDRITLQARTSFYELILAERQLEVTRSSIATAEQTLTQARSDYANGRVRQLVVRQAELALQTARLTLRRQSVQRENALAAFKDLLGIPQETQIELSGSLSPEPVSTTEILRDGRLAERPDVRSAEAQIELQRSRNRAERLSLVTPTLTLQASVAPLFPAPFSPGNPVGGGWNDRGSLSVSLSAGSLLAFLPFVPQRVALKVGEETLRSLELRRQEVLANARTEVASLLRTLDASKAAVDSLTASLALAQESYDLTKEAYAVGGVDFLTLKSAEDDLLTARYALLSEEYTYLTSLIALEYATGLSLRSVKEK